MLSGSIDRMQEPVVLEQCARRLSEDMETPVSLFMGMRRKEGAVLLESTEVDGRWGRYSIMGFDPLLTVRCGNGRLSLTIADSRLAPLASYEGLPFVEGLRRVMRALHIQADETAASLPHAARALYGYLGFGMAGIFAPHLAAILPPEQAECVLILPRTVLIFDHLYNTFSQASYGPHPELAGIHGGAVPVSVAVEEINSNPGENGYKSAVQRIKSQLESGEAIQVVPSVRFSVPCEGDCFTLYRRLRECNPSPYMFYMEFPEGELFGASPEVMLRCTESRMCLSPIAGTRPRGSNPAEDARLADELLQDPKERAEHIMLVDLARNDLGRVARPGSVEVKRLMDVERFSHVMHLTSCVEADAGEGVDVLDMLAASFPAGTVSGAPKVRAIEILTAEENQARGPYAGCIGWIGLDGRNMDTGITLRSLWRRGNRLYWQAGSGIVHDSDPENEWKEVCNKAAVMRQILGSTGR